MPIDPRIALQTQGIEVPGMANAYERFLNAKAQREATSQRSELHKAQMSEIQRRTEAEKQAEARATQAREVLGQGGKAADVMAIDPDLGMKLSKEERDAAAARTKATLDEYDAELKQLSISKQKLDRLGSIAGSINDETTFDIGVAQAIRLGLPPEMGAKLLAQGYTDESKKILDQFKMEAMTVDKQLEEKRAEVEAKYKAAEEARKSELHPMAVQKAENEVVTGTPDERGLTPAQVAQDLRERMESDRRSADARAGRAVTMRGQDMTDKRSREMAELTREDQKARREERPLNEYESRNFGFYDRARQATEVLDSLESSMASKGPIGQLYYNNAPNMVQTEENQKYRQGQEMFLNAFLRRDSGAVITPAEEKMGARTFFFQPGDTPAVIEQKRKSRETVINSLKVGAGRAYERMSGGSPKSNLADKSTDDLLKMLAQ